MKGEVRTKRLGFWFSDKKRSKILPVLPSICRAYGLELVQIDLTKPLEIQGPFCAILHKLTDVIVKAESAGNDDADSEANQHKRIVQEFERYLAARPQILVIDPIDNVRLLLDRLKTYQLIEESQLAKDDGVFTPSFVELATTNVVKNLLLLKNAGVNFPFVCKPSVAHGSRLAHQMAVIFNENGVKDITPPCVAQTFICHDAVLYKLFAIGEKWFQVERPSLKNFYAGDHSTIFFDSHDVSKANAVSSLNQLDEADVGKPISKPTQALFQKIVMTLRKILGMALFGVDVVIENKTGKYGIIDINAFPGYDGVPDFYETLVKFIAEEIEERKQANAECGETAQTLDCNQEDSGIETGDSSDEKKDKKLQKPNKRQQQRALFMLSQCGSITETKS